MKLEQRARKFLGRDPDGEDFQVTRTDGSYVFDGNGKRYIDFLAGWCVGNLGWGHTTVRRPSVTYAYPYYLYRPWVELAELLAKITPGKLQKCFRATGGSEAVEIALQIAMIHTGRGKFMSIEDAYHGNTIGGLSIGASSNRENYPNLLRNCLKIAPPLNRDAIEKVERLLRKRDVAAFIMEPVSCNLNVLVPDDAFMTGLAKLCRRYGTLLIMDEVACGFGRTGKLFATEHFGIAPDIMCLAKAITGGQAPMGAVITTPAVAKSAEKEGSFYSTYGWHPIAVEAALTNVRYWIKHKNKLLVHVDGMSALFQERLSQIEFQQRASVRIKGLAIAAEFKNAHYAEKLASRCQENGLLLTTSDNALTMFPPLNIEEKLVCEGLSIIERAATEAN
ncbi:MAG TPA: aspartate aminotransferase family protein [Chthoniobacterales bacterium]|nr:aspartate aminotransferase family protein [Chthoniobacterales bacterium]